MFIDHPDTLRAFGGDPGDAAPPLATTADTAGGDLFAERLAVACGLTGRLWQAPAAVAPEWPPAGEVTLLACRGVVVSPYAALRDLTAAGQPLPGPVACLTLGGTALQGQHGRRWQALPGNLHLSVALPCDLDAGACTPALPMLPAVAVCDAVEELVGAAAAGAAGLGIKWVNDIVLGPRKLGGVLTAVREQGTRVAVVFAGVGLNLARAPHLPPDPFTLPAAALAELGPPPALAVAACAVLRRLRAQLAALATAGPGDLVEAYRARSVVLGREVGVWPETVRTATAGAGPRPQALPAPVRRGRVATVGADLALGLEGQAEPVREGCLRLLDPVADG